MKNRFNFLWKSFRFCTLLAVMSFIAFSMLACDASNASGGSGKATLIITNVSQIPAEIITELNWTNTGTGLSQKVSPLAVPVLGKHTISLDEGTYNIFIVTNNVNGSNIINEHIYGGSVLNLVWDGQTLKKS